MLVDCSTDYSFTVGPSSGSMGHWDCCCETTPDHTKTRFSQPHSYPPELYTRGTTPTE